MVALDTDLDTDLDTALDTDLLPSARNMDPSMVSPDPARDTEYLTGRPMASLASARDTALLAQVTAVTVFLMSPLVTVMALSMPLLATVMDLSTDHLASARDMDLLPSARVMVLLMSLTAMVRPMDSLAPVLDTEFPMSPPAMDMDVPHSLMDDPATTAALAIMASR